MKKLLLIIVLFVIQTQAQNPIIPGHADPHMRVFDGKMYISVGKDKSPDNEKFYIVNWSVFSSDDLVNWELETVIDPKDTHLGKGYEYCWATDITTRNGKYYLYASENYHATSVFVSDKPNGPYRDVLGKSLIPESLSENHEYDPSILIDDDGSQYIVFGRDGQVGKNLFHYQIAKLNEDMISYQEPKDLLTDGEFGFGEKNRARDHQYIHKYNGIYYLSCAGAYRTSLNPYGPYENERHSGQNGHSSFSEFNGQTYHSFEWTDDRSDNRRFRQTSLTYLHYKDNGDMVSDPMFIQGFKFSSTMEAERGKYFDNGVGRYDANWPKIESEWFFKKEGHLVKKEAPNDGFQIQNIQNGDALYFPKVRNLKGKKEIIFTISSINNANGSIEIHKGSKTGELLGTCSIPNTKKFTEYQEVSCPIQNVPDQEDLVFVFKGNQGELLRIDSFSIK